RVLMSAVMALALVVFLGAGGQSDIQTAAPSSVGVPSCPEFDANALPAPSTDVTTAVGTLPGKLDVSDSGSAVYTIPLEVMPGRLGVQPSLSLAYNSDSGNGILGMGFSLQGYSSISRCPRTVAEDGQWREVRYDTNDHFCLDG